VRNYQVSTENSTGQLFPYYYFLAFFCSWNGSIFVFTAPSTLYDPGKMEVKFPASTVEVLIATKPFQKLTNLVVYWYYRY